MYRTYQELMTFSTFEDRYNYLKLNGIPTETTFGGHRQVNQILYQSPEWKRLRRKVIIRDRGCDLGIDDRPISKPNKILIHHINPITLEQITSHDPAVFDPNNLITCSFDTHQAIHYGSESLLVPSKPTERHPGDTCPWLTG